MASERGHVQAARQKQHHNGHASAGADVQVGDDGDGQRQNDEVRKDVQRGLTIAPLGRVEAPLRRHRRVPKGLDRPARKDAAERDGGAVQDDKGDGGPDTLFEAVLREDAEVEEEDGYLDDGIADDVEDVVGVVELWQRRGQHVRSESRR